MLKASKFLIATFLLAPIALIIWLSYQGFLIAEELCYAWNASKSLSDTLGYFYLGFPAAVRKNFLIGNLFSYDYNSFAGGPDLKLSIFVMVLVALVLGALAFAIFKLIRSSASEGRMSLKGAAVFVAVFGVLSFVGAHYMANSKSLAPENKDVDRYAPIDTVKKDREDLKKWTNPGTMSLYKRVMEKKITPQELDSEIQKLLAKDLIGDQMVSRIFHYTLAQCQVDLARVLKKHPQKPSFDRLDKSYMKSQSEKVRDTACRQLYAEFGWAECRRPDCSWQPGDVKGQGENRYLTMCVDSLCLDQVLRSHQGYFVVPEKTNTTFVPLAISPDEVVALNRFRQGTGFQSSALKDQENTFYIGTLIDKAESPEKQIHTLVGYMKSGEVHFYPRFTMGPGAELRGNVLSKNILTLSFGGKKQEKLYWTSDLIVDLEKKTLFVANYKESAQPPQVDEE